MGMGFLWESNGKRPMGWDGHKLLWDKYVPWTTLQMPDALYIFLPLRKDSARRYLKF